MAHTSRLIAGYGRLDLRRLVHDERPLRDHRFMDLGAGQDEEVRGRNGFESHEAATAGEPVLARLPQSLVGLSDAVAAATIQTAWLINGPEALDVLARYAADRRVDFELSMAWDYFDPDEYAERVLAAMAPGGSVYIEHSPTQLAALGKVSPLSELEVHLTGQVDLSFLAAHAASLRDLALYYEEPGADLTALPELPELQSLAMGLPGLADLGFLDPLPQLETVWLTHCQNIEDYTPLLRFTGLQTLVLSGSRRLRALRQLPPLKAVGSLSLAGSALGRGELDPLVGAAPNLIYLYLEDCDWLDDLAPLARLKLQDLRIRGSSAVSDLRPLSGQANLRFLDVSLTRVSDLTPLGRGHPTEDLAADGLQCRRRPAALGRAAEPRGTSHRRDRGWNRPDAAGTEPAGDRVRRRRAGRARRGGAGA